MERKLASIQKIAEIQPIEGADRIVKVRINDWWCVALKGEFKEGDPCVYFEIDSLLPIDNPAFDFLAKSSKPKTMNIDGKEHVGYRLKTIRLRGQISQGLALPLRVVPLAAIREEGSYELKSRYKIGDDVSEIMGVVKYEAPIPAELAGQMKGNLPGFLRKTDEERVQNMGEVVLRNLDLKYYVTEKLDGASTTYYKRDGEVGVCSRNLDLFETEGNTLWRVGRETGILDRLPDNYAVQGEMVGPGIQANPLKLSNQKFFAYNVWDIIRQKYLDFDEMVSFLNENAIEMVPTLEKNYTLPTRIEELIIGADGPSRLNAGAKREGIVIRPMEEKLEEIRGSENQRYSFKVISNEYLLKVEQ